MIPKIGETITTNKALDLCRSFGIDYLIERIEINPEAFKDWVFDGASMIPDALFAQVFDIPSLTEIGLRHDLKYGYGELGNHQEKARVDEEFKQELLGDGASPTLAQLMYQAVDTFGGGPIATDFSWGFARK
ncbi:hypothetical protein BROC_02214 [Candidatus Brocadiaceae bacterium]|nr:hypothetical protein BROC_02214 [Candidatus Brocadiaceae bacterium]